jgi:hypothetical protein
MKNSTTTTTTVKIPASVTHDHAYAYGYLASSLFYLEGIADYMEENDLQGLQYLLRRIKDEAQKARELDADMSRRADERIKKILAA